MQPFEQQLAGLKEKLLTMASHAESSVYKVIEALGKRDYDLAQRVEADDTVIDRFEVEVDDLAIKLLAQAPRASDLRLITVAMKISQNLERVGDETTTIARRVQELCQDAPLKLALDLPQMATLAAQMLKRALDAFVNQDPAAARALIPQDKEVDLLNKQNHQQLADQMIKDPGRRHALPEPDGHLQEPGTHRRPRQERGGGSGLPVRSPGHPAQRSAGTGARRGGERHTTVTCLSHGRHCRSPAGVVPISA